MIKKILKRIKDIIQIFLAKRYKHVYLPYFRANENLNNNEIYVKSTIQQIKTLKQYSSISNQTRLLDFGCGPGRLAIGLLFECPDIGEYCGIDTDKFSIKWCKLWIQKYHPHYSFIHVDAHHARYNPSASQRPELPVPQNRYDIAFVNSVFSHMLSDDVKFYLQQINEALNEGGILYFTAFIEENVPDEEENPAYYLNRPSTLPLHRVRYERDYFFMLIKNAGFNILDFDHQGIIRTRQSVVIAKKITDQI